MSLSKNTVPFLIFALMLTVAVSAGCGRGSSAREQGEVTGKVTLNGVPLTNGSVNFYSSNSGAGALCPLDESGSYRIKYLNAPDTYTVTLLGPEQIPGQPAPPPSEIPTKYQSSSTSGLTVELKQGRNTFDISLEK